MNGERRAVPVKAAIDRFGELDHFRNGGILHDCVAGAGQRRRLVTEL